MTFCRKVRSASGQTPVHHCSPQVSSRHWIISHVVVTHCMCSSRAMKYIAYSLTWLLISDSRSPTYLPCPDTCIVHQKSTWWRPSNLDLPMLRLYTFTMSIHCRDWLTQMLATFVKKPMETGRPGQGTLFDRVATAQGKQGKQGIWFLLFPDRENTGNFAVTQGKFFRHRENILSWHKEKFRHRENNWLSLLK